MNYEFMETVNRHINENKTEKKPEYSRFDLALMGMSAVGYAAFFYALIR